MLQCLLKMLNHFPYNLIAKNLDHLNLELLLVRRNFYSVGPRKNVSAAADDALPLLKFSLVLAVWQ